jgi:hypothetical protein
VIAASSFVSLDSDRVGSQSARLGCQKVATNRVFGFPWLHFPASVFLF